MRRGTAGVFLLDVNVVLAIIDPAHEHHRAAYEWFAQEGRQGFATCPIVENGVLRIASSAAYPNRPGDVDTVRSVLQHLCSLPGHTFWADSISLLTMLPPITGLSSRQVTDGYLVALAARFRGRLTTFDRSVPTRQTGIDPGVVLILGG